MFLFFISILFFLNGIAHPTHVAAANWTLMRLFCGGLKLGPPDFWFAIIWFLLEMKKITYLNDMMPFVTEQMIFRMKNHRHSASLTGFSGYIQTPLRCILIGIILLFNNIFYFLFFVYRLDCAIMFTLCSPLFNPAPPPQFDPLRAHIICAQGFLKLVHAAGFKIPDIVKTHVNRLQVLISLLNKVKKIGRGSMLSIAEELIQNSYYINKNNISKQFANIKHFPQFNIPFIPLDGPATDETRAPALELLNLTNKPIPINEIYNSHPLSKAIALLTTSTTLNKGLENLTEHFMSGGIQDSNSFVDGNCTVHAFVDTIYKCGEVYSASDILVKNRASIGIYVFLFILAAFAFTIVLNSYWPMLISMFNTLMRVEQNQTGKIKGTKVKIVDLQDGTPVLGREKSGICDNKMLLVWIVLCVSCTFVAAIFISAVGVSFIDLYTTPKTESICTPMVSKRRLSNQEDQNMELIKILSEDEEGNTVLIMPCGASLKDEFGNTYRLDGPYKLECGEMQEFQYIIDRQVWHAGHCCGWPGVPGDWKNPTGSTEYKVNPGCGPCKEWFKAAYKCITTPVHLQRCEWLETDDGNTHLFVKRFNNDIEEEKNISLVTLTVSPALTTPYGFWRNDTSYIINTAFNNYLENTNFNYTCKPVYIPTNGNDYILPAPQTVNPMPQLTSCMTLVKVPFTVEEMLMDFCTVVNIVHNIESNSYGFVSQVGDCSIKVKDDLDQTSYLYLSMGSYRFMKSVNQIACIDMGDGLYLNCSSKNFTIIVPSEKGYDHVKEVVVDHTNIGGEVDWNFENPFEDLFKSNVKDIITIVIIIILVIVAAIILFVVLKFLYRKFQQDKERNYNNNNSQMTHFINNPSSISVHDNSGGDSSVSDQNRH
jgi:hypothetical protein